MKKLWLSVLLFLVLIYVVGCGDQANKETDEKIELTFSMWGNDEHIAMYDELLKDFYIDHPNITVKIQPIPYADYQQKMSVSAAGEELPDIGWVAERMAPQFIDNGILRDVSELKNDEDFDYDDYISSTLELWDQDGKLYGLPFSTPPMIMYYNKSLFTNKGLKTPTELAKNGEWTWKKFREVAADLSEGEGSNRTYGAKLWIDWSNYSTMFSHTWSNGGSIFSEDMKQFKWNSPEGEKTFRMLKEMMFDEHSHITAGEELPFESGRIAMYSDYYSYISKARGIEDFDWDIAPMPSGTNGSVPMLGMAGIVAFEGSDHPDEAYELLKFLGSKKGIAAQSAFFVPPRSSVLSSDEFIDVPNNPSRESIKLALLDPMENGHTAPLHPEWDQIESLILEGFDKLYTREYEISDILEEMESEINPILQE